MTMATKQTTQLCYQVNGGICRNKVSAKNSYICAAGHRATKDMSRDEIATQLPLEAIRKMGRDAQHELAKNPSIDADIAQALFDTEDEDTRCNLARNPSIDRAMMQALFDAGEYRIRWYLATNPSIDRDVAIKLAKDEYRPVGYLKNKSITELCERENISLLNEHPEKFGRAYLYHLLRLDKNLEEVKALLCYSYDCYRKADGYSSERYKGQILEKYPNDEEVKILLS